MMFDRTTRFLHWSTAMLMIMVFIVAFSIDLATSRPSHVAFLQLHRSLGLAVWLLTLTRLAWRQVAKYPDWPSDMPIAMRTLARASEYTLYLLLLLQPILGLLQTNARGDRVNLFFTGQLPALIGVDRPLAHQLLIAHKAVGFSLLTLIVLHVGAALFHHFVRRDNILSRMLPAAAAWRSRKPAVGVAATQGSMAANAR